MPRKYILAPYPNPIPKLRLLSLGSIVVDSFSCSSPFRGDSLLGLCFVMQYFVSFLVLQSSCHVVPAGCFALIVILMSWDCKCSMALPHSAVGLWCLAVSLSLFHRYPGQVWYSILSVPDLCTIAYFVCIVRLLYYILTILSILCK